MCQARAIVVDMPAVLVCGCWLQEVEQVLGPERAHIFCRAYHFKSTGNCTFSELSDPHRWQGRAGQGVISCSIHTMCYVMDASIQQSSWKLAAAHVAAAGKGAAMHYRPGYTCTNEGCDALDCKHN
jgi:hypothetical protein